MVPFQIRDLQIDFPFERFCASHDPSIALSSSTPSYFCQIPSASFSSILNTSSSMNLSPPPVGPAPRQNFGFSGERSP
ncbi:hypothetical protein LXL04_019730 [Taraxacum kok-saghyz]